MGYRYLAMSTSEKTHKIPIEKNGERDYRRILAELESFVSAGRKGELPPVFAKVDQGKVEIISYLDANFKFLPITND